MSDRQSITEYLAEPPAPPAPAPIFSANPEAVLASSRQIARALKAVLIERNLVKQISGREYVFIEGWTLLGSMVGVFAEIEWTRPMVGMTDADLGTRLGWEARAVAKTVDGRRISAAEASCGRDEYHWKKRDEYALRSMAQTRAISKALRLPLGFIVELAGYSATPAEELPSPAVQATPAARRLRSEIEAAAEERGVSSDQLRAMADEAGVRERATVPQLRAILQRVLATDIDDLPSLNGETDDGDQRPEHVAEDASSEDASSEDA